MIDLTESKTLRYLNDALLALSSPATKVLACMACLDGLTKAACNHLAS